MNSVFSTFAGQRSFLDVGWAGLARARTLFAVLAIVFMAATGAASANAEEVPVLPLTVNVNTADARTIANVLQGVGLSRAAAIVSYRDQNGAFKSVDSLTAVKGIGDRTVELNATRILLAD